MAAFREVERQLLVDQVVFGNQHALWDWNDRPFAVGTPLLSRASSGARYRASEAIATEGHREVPTDEPVSVQITGDQCMALFGAAAAHAASRKHQDT